MQGVSGSQPAGATASVPAANAGDKPGGESTGTVTAAGGQASTTAPGPARATLSVSTAQAEGCGRSAGSAGSAGLLDITA